MRMDVPVPCVFWDGSDTLCGEKNVLRLQACFLRLRRGVELQVFLAFFCFPYS